MSRRRESQAGLGEMRIFAGRYEYEKPLGRGAGGAVYLVRDRYQNQRHAALKVLSAEAYDTVQGKMLRREFEILSKLKHPNLVEVYDYGTLPDGGVYLAEEYIDGFSLQDARALLEPDALVDVTIQILSGLAYLHAMGTIHRDIKPANVMLLWLDDAAARPMVKLVDFGLSSMNPKRDTLRGGTRSYMAPEIIRGEKAQVRSDLYSLGVTLYYALCGVLPFGPRSKDDPPPTEEGFRPPDPHRLNEEVPLELSRFTMALLRQVDGVDFADAGEALQALSRQAPVEREKSIGQLANSFDASAIPVIRGYFERGILSRRRQESDLIQEWLSVSEPERGGGLYLIEADEGSGKSRLLDELASAAKLSGYQVIKHQGGEGVGPFGDFLEWAEKSLQLAIGQGHRELHRMWEAFEVRRELSRVGVVTAGSRDKYMDQEWWMVETLGVISKRLSATPLVILIDDLERCDDFSLELFYRWYREASDEGGRPAVVATSTPGSVSMRCQQLEGGHVMPIEGVNRSDIESFFIDQLGLEGLSEEWIEAVEKGAAGRPSYVQELCRQYIDEGLMWRASVGQWKGRLEDIEVMGVPDSLRQSLRQRLSRVGVAVRECVELLALVGHATTWELVRDLLLKGGHDRQEAERIMHRALNRHLIVMELSAQERTVDLVEPQLGEAVLDMLSSKWRRALHRRIGRVLWERWRTEGQDPGEIADHLKKGGLDEEGATFLELAAEGLASQGKHRQAIALWESALESSQTSPSRAWVHHQLALSQLARFNAGRSKHHISKALDTVDGAGQPWLWQKCLLSRAYVGWALGLPQWMEESLQSLEGQPDASWSFLEALFEITTGHLDRSEACLEGLRSTKGYEKNRQRQGAYHLARAHIAGLRGQEAKALRHYQEVLDTAVNDGATEFEGLVYLYYGRDLRRLNSLSEARTSLERALESLSSSVGPHLYIDALFELAWLLLLKRQPQAAQRRIQEGLALARRLEHRHYERKLHLFQMGLNLRDADDPEAATRDVVEAVETYDWGDYYLFERAEMLMVIGELVIARGDKGAGPSILQRGRQLAYELGAEALLPPVAEGPTGSST